MSEISLYSISENQGLSELYNVETFESLKEQGHKAIEDENFSLAIEIIHKMDRMIPKNISSGTQRTQVRDLIRDLLNSNSLKGLSVFDTPFDNFEFTVNKNVVSYISEFIMGSFTFKLMSAPEVQELLKEVFQLFQEADKKEAFDKKFADLFQLYECGKASTADLFFFLYQLAKLNIIKFETLLPLPVEAFTVKLDGATLFLSSPNYSITYTSYRYLLRDYESALKLIDEEEDPDDQIEYCFEIAELYPEKEGELLERAKSIFSSLEDKLSSCWTFARHYLKKEDVANLKETARILRELSKEVPENEKISSLLSIASIEAEIALLEKDLTAFELQISKMKQNISKVEDPKDTEYFQKDIQDLEERGSQFFVQDQMVMHALKV